jgi:hypothetical protein
MAAPREQYGYRSMNSSELTAVIKQRAQKAQNHPALKVQSASEVTERRRKAAAGQVISSTVDVKYNPYSSRSAEQVTEAVAGRAYRTGVQDVDVFKYFSNSNPQCCSDPVSNVFGGATLTFGRPADLCQIPVQLVGPSNCLPLPEARNAVRCPAPQLNTIKGPVPLGQAHIYLTSGQCATNVLPYAIPK